MTTARTIARSFAGGEISSELFGRMDLDKYQTGLAKCENFIVLPHGPAQNRPGFAFVNQVKDSSRRVRLIDPRYVQNAEQETFLQSYENMILQKIV